MTSSTFTPSTRRIFLLQMAIASAATAGTAAFAATPVAPAGPAGKVDEKDPTAVALGYVSDASKVDRKKYPKSAADQKCSGCALYQGKAGDAQGPCPIFAGKQVSSGGWCSSWVKKG